MNKKLVLAVALTVATSFNAMGADIKVAPQAEAATAEKTDWLTVGAIQANKVTNKLRSVIRIKQAGEEAKFYIANVKLDVTKPVVKEMVKEAEDKLTPEAK